MSQKDRFVRPAELDLLIRDGLVFDGTGRPPERADIGVSGEKIAFVGKAGENTRAKEHIRAEGLCVAPGFIDTHCHSEFTLLADPQAAEGKLFQGITTEINGNCGLSGGPLLGAAAEQREEDLRELGIKERWEGLGQYLSILEGRRPVMNFATLVGHGNLRASAMGYADTHPTARRMEKMKGLLKEALDAGAIGLSSGLIYPPGVYAGTGELAALAGWGRQVAEEQKRPFIYTTHMRSESDEVVEAVREAVVIGRQAGALNISHLKTSGERNWHKLDAVIEEIEAARAGGLRATADRYPYTAASTELDALFPPWVYEGGVEAELGRLNDPAAIKRLEAEMKEKPVSWGAVFVSSTPCEADKWMEGKSIEEIASRLGTARLEAVFQIIIRGRARVGAIFHGMSEDNLKRLYGLPWVMVGSDSAARSFSGITAAGKPHPRGFGTFPRYLKRYTIEERITSIEEAVRKTAGLPAGVFGLRKRGLIREAWEADITIFDPRALKDTAVFGSPFEKALGVAHVIINGVPVISDGVLTGKRPGKVLRGGG